MPTWLKVVLGLTLAFVLLIGLVVGGGVLWFSKNKGQLVAMGEKATREGRALRLGAQRPGVHRRGRAAPRRHRPHG